MHAAIFPLPTNVSLAWYLPVKGLLILLKGLTADTPLSLHASYCGHPELKSAELERVQWVKMVAAANKHSWLCEVVATNVVQCSDRKTCLLSATISACGIFAPDMMKIMTLTS